MRPRISQLFGSTFERTLRNQRVQLAAFRLVRLVWLPFMLELRLLSALVRVFGSPPMRGASPAARRAALLYLMIDGVRPRSRVLPIRFDLPLVGFLRSVRSYRLRHRWVFFSGLCRQTTEVKDLEDLLAELESERSDTFETVEKMGWRLRLVSVLTLGLGSSGAIAERGKGGVDDRLTVAAAILGARNCDLERVVGLSDDLQSGELAKLLFYLTTPPVRAVLAQSRYNPADRRHRRIAHSAWQVGRASSRLQSGILREQLEKAGGLDPAVFFGIEKRTILSYGHLRDQMRKVDALRSLVGNAGDGLFRALVVIPHCRHSGAARVAAEVCHALVGRFGPEGVLLLQTDLSDFAVPHWFPKGIRRIDFYGATCGLPPLEARRLLVEFIRSCGSEVVYNVNSGGFWRAYASFGSQLGREMRIYSYFFCSDRNAEGREVGYPVTYFAEALLHHAGIFFDSRYLRDQMLERFRCAGWSGTTEVLYTPAAESVASPVERRPDKARRTIFWCGRLDPQKRFDLVVEIAKRMPECDFRVWGKRVLGTEDYGMVPENVRLEGVFSNLGELPLADFDLWLFTSAWEGIPTILLDLAPAELPLVSSFHTGLTDLLEPDGAYLVESFDPDDYVAAIRAAFDDPAEAKRRAGRLREKVASRHRPERFAESLLAASGFAVDGEGAGILAPEARDSQRFEAVNSA